MYTKSDFKYLLIVFLSLMIIGCAHVRVLPGPGGEHRVVVRDVERDGAEKAALSAAEKYCEEHGGEIVVLEESTVYTGSMDEETRKVIRNASEATRVIDPAHENIGQAGAVGSIMTSDRDYEAEIIFKCQ
jgi:hypothetical protein